MKLAIDQEIDSSQIQYLQQEDAYNSLKWTCGKGWGFNNGIGKEKYFSPVFGAARPIEESTAIPLMYSFAVPFSNTKDYVFSVENLATAVATRRITLYEVNTVTGARSWKGFITVTLGSATSHMAKDFKIDYLSISATASASGTAVTLSAGAPVTNRVAVGARIGWGATPKDVATWYRVSAITSDVSVTLASTAGTIGSGQCWIEEFRPVLLNTNVTTTNGGVHLAKGVTIEDYISTGTTISAATTVDNVKATYWLKDASTVTNLVASGMVIDIAGQTNTNLDCYVQDLVSAGNYKYYKYNLRAALASITAGATTSAFVLATGNNTFTGTGQQNASLAIATTAHGTGSGVKCLYAVTNTRIYRFTTASITSASTTVFTSGDNITEVAPGGANTFASISGLNSIEYMSSIDAFVLGAAGNGGDAQRTYLTKYVSSGQQFNLIWGRAYGYLEQSTKDNGHPTLFSIQTAANLVFTDSGNFLYCLKQSNVVAANHLFVLPFGCDFNYADTTQGYLISPKIATSNASKYYKSFANHVNLVGGGNLAISPEPFKLYARTANIDSDMTTGWIEIDDTNDISAFAGSTHIQFKILAKTIAEHCMPCRILGFTVTFEDNSGLANYQFSKVKSSETSKIFAWRFKTAFGSSVPALKVNLYDGITGGLLVTDNTTSPTGTFERSTDGTSWGAWNNTDKANETTYIRYTPASLADNINVQPVLTLL